MAEARVSPMGVLRAGASPLEAPAAVVLLHGRGGTAANILGLVPELGRPDLAYLAPQAPGNTWYPLSFLAPTEHNEPALSMSLLGLGALLTSLEESGMPPARVVLLGFSQGACLALEHTARAGQPLGGVIAFTGGLIGPPGRAFPEHGELAGTPVFLGSSDPDPHVPRWRVEESAAVLEHLGAEVDLRLYPGLGHTIHDDELQAARALLERAAPQRGSRVSPGI